jgi:hypothetical protein
MAWGFVVHGLQSGNPIRFARRIGVINLRSWLVQMIVECRVITEKRSKLGRSRVARERAAQWIVDAGQQRVGGIAVFKAFDREWKAKGAALHSVHPGWRVPK